MPLTKEMIDALVDGMVPSRVWPGAVKLDSKPGGWIKDADELKRQLYVSAGLTAEGERKPERVRCWSYRYDGNGPYVSSADPNGFDFAADVTPGWFVPDGAE